MSGREGSCCSDEVDAAAEAFDGAAAVVDGYTAAGQLE